MVTELEQLKEERKTVEHKKYHLVSRQLSNQSMFYVVKKLL